MSQAKIQLSRNFPVSQSGKLATAAAMQLVNPDFRFDASGCGAQFRECFVAVVLREATVSAAKENACCVGTAADPA